MHDHRMTDNGKRFYVLRLPLFHVVGTVRRRRCQTAPTEGVIKTLPQPNHQLHRCLLLRSEYQMM